MIERDRHFLPTNFVVNPFELPYIYSYIYASILTCKYINILIYIYIHTHSYVCIYIIAHTHTHPYIYIHTHTHLWMIKYMYIYENKIKSTRYSVDGIIYSWIIYPCWTFRCCIFWIIRNHHHHHVVPLARISLTLSCHFSLSFIASGRSSGLHPVSSHSCWMYVRAGRPAFARPYVGIHRGTSLMSSSLLLQ